MTERQKHLNELSQYCFAAFDTALFLDTHPDDVDAVKAFDGYRNKAADLRASYEAKYGPLTYTASSGDTWEWVDSPWPWERERGND